MDSIIYETTRGNAREELHEMLQFLQTRGLTPTLIRDPQDQAYQTSEWRNHLKSGPSLLTPKINSYVTVPEEQLALARQALDEWENREEDKLRPMVNSLKTALVLSLVFGIVVTWLSIQFYFHEWNSNCIFIFLGVSMVTLMVVSQILDRGKPDGH